MAEQILSADTDYADDLRQKLKEAEHNYDNDSPFDHPLYHLVGYLINVVGIDFSKIEDMLRNLGASDLESSYIIEDSIPFYVIEKKYLYTNVPACYHNGFRRVILYI